MPQNTHLESISAEAERLPEPVHAARNPQVIHEGAAELARTLTWLPNSPSSHTFAERSRVLAHDFKPIFTALELPTPEVPISDDFRWLYDNSRLLYAELQNTASIKSRAEITHVRTPNGETVPRVLALAEGFLELVSYEFSEQEFILFVEVFQQTQALLWRELRELVSALRLVLLEQVVVRGKQLLSDPRGDSHGVGLCVRSLREIGHTNWKDALEPEQKALQHLLRAEATFRDIQVAFGSKGGGSLGLVVEPVCRRDQHKQDNQNHGQIGS